MGKTSEEMKKVGMQRMDESLRNTNEINQCLEVLVSSGKVDLDGTFLSQVRMMTEENQN
jgi:hypothetical protein